MERKRALLEREARRMAGYRHGGLIVDEFMGLIEAAGTPQDFEAQVSRLLTERDDPRLAEIYGNLQGIIRSAVKPA